MAALSPAHAPTASADPVLRVDGIVKRFAAVDETVTAVDHISFSVAQGEVLAVIGPSGCGKSTLFNIIGGLTEADQGQVVVEGQTVSGPHPAIGMVFQDESTFPWRTVAENVAFPLEIGGTAREERIARRTSISRSSGCRIRAALPVGAVRRHAAARCHRADARVSSQDSIDGRAVCGARRADSISARRQGAVDSAAVGATTLLVTTTSPRPCSYPIVSW